MTAIRASGQARPSYFPMRRPDLTEGLEQGDARLAAVMAPTVQTFPARKAIIGAGPRSRSIYRIRSGWCARVRYLPDGQGQILAILLPGDFFAIETLFQTCHMDDEVIALDSATVECAEWSVIERAMFEDRQLALRLTWELVEAERRIRNWLVAMGRGSAEEKLALLLLDLRGRLALGGVIPADAVSFVFPMTQHQIGEALGLTAVHVNRTLQHFRKVGLVTLSRNLMTLDDLEGLYRLALPLLDEFEKSRPEYGAAARSRTGQSTANIAAGLHGQVSA